MTKNMASEDDADYCPDSSVSAVSEHSSSDNDQSAERPSNAADVTIQREDDNTPRDGNATQNGPGGSLLAGIQKSLDFLTAPHHGWDPSGQRMAKCDLCDRAGHPVVYKCSECKLTICKECCETGKLRDPRHHLDPDSVSWEPPPKVKRARIARAANQAGGGRRGLRARGLRARGGRARGRNHTVSRTRSQSPSDARSTIVVDCSRFNTPPDEAVPEHEENAEPAKRDKEQPVNRDPPARPPVSEGFGQSQQPQPAIAQRLPELAPRSAHSKTSSQHHPGVLHPPQPMHPDNFLQPHLQPNNGNTPIFPPRPAGKDGLMRQGAQDHRFAPYPPPQDRGRTNDAHYNGNMGPPQVFFYGHPHAGVYRAANGFAPTPTHVQPSLMPVNYPRPGSENLQGKPHQVGFLPQGPAVNPGGPGMSNHGQAPAPHAPPPHHHHRRHHHHHHKRTNPADPCSQAQKQNRLPSISSLLNEADASQTGAPTPQHGAPPYRPGPQVGLGIFPGRPQNRGILHPVLAPPQHPNAPESSTPGASATRPVVCQPGTPSVQPNIEILGNRLIQASLSLRDASPNVTLEHCLRHEIDMVWKRDVLPAAYIEPSFCILLSATYYAITSLGLDPRQNAARAWISEKERALIGLGYDPVRSMQNRSC